MRAVLRTDELLSPHARKQRGVIALPSVMVLMLALALTMLYAHRHARWEQRGANHLLHARAAFEVAESGLAWARARLNDPSPIDPEAGGCTPSGHARARSFRDLYAPNEVLSDGIGRALRPTGATRLMCSVANDGTPRCSCPTSDTSLNTPSEEDRFVVRIESDPHDRDVLRLHSMACLRNAASCIDGNASAPNLDALARVSVKLKRTLRLAQLPRAPLTATGPVALCGGATLVNDSAHVDGWLAHAGGRMTIGTTPACAAMDRPSLQTPLSPSDQALQSLDSSLGALGDRSDAFALRWLGRSWDAFRDESCHVTGGNADERGALLVAMTSRVQHPCTQVWIDGDATVPAGTIVGRPRSGHEPARPVLVATASRLRFASGSRVYGLVIVDGPMVDDIAADAQIVGALLVRGEARSSSGTLRFDLGALADLAVSGPFERVPGSWIDE